jgi:cytoplasmic iron level regulating protein YaaA (DUF328/UPF0246 family)
MIIILSPAKTLDFEHDASVKTMTEPRLAEDASQIMKKLSEYDEPGLEKLMKISSKLASLNALRHRSWSATHTNENSKQAIYAFRGEVYNGIDIDRFNVDEMEFAQQHVRILSGLYGVLRPLDRIQPYRLEMGTKLNIDKNKNLYEFWGNSITEVLQKDLDATQNPVLVNLASNEYSKSVKTDALSAPIVTPVFKELKNGDYKVIAIYAKKARGLMTAYVIKNRITNAEDLKSFDEDGYMFDVNLSTDNEWVFTRG